MFQERLTHSLHYSEFVELTLFSLFIIASGLTFLETGANPFIVELGNKETAERRLNLSQAFNPIGSILGVIIGTVFVFSGIDPDASMIEEMKSTGTYDSFLQKETLQVVRPYLVLAAIALIWILAAFKVKFPEIKQNGNLPKTSMKKAITILFKNKSFLNGAFTLFLYVGAQVGTWSYFIFYVQEYVGVDEKTAGYMLTGTIIAFALGRMSAIGLMKKISPAMMIGIYSILNVILVALCMIFTNSLGMWCLLLTSFFMSVMYPTIFSLSVKGLGEQSEVGSSILVMAILGGAVLTPLMGFIMDKTSIACAMSIPLVAYLYICFYSYCISKK